MVGSSTAHTAASSQSEHVNQRRPRYDADVLVAELPYERQSTAFEQFVAISTEVRLAPCLSLFLLSAMLASATCVTSLPYVACYVYLSVT